MATQRNEAIGPQKSFVIEMRARRDAAGLSRHRLAEALGCTPQWLAKVENYEKAPSEPLSDDLDTYWKAGGTFRRLWEQMVEARRQGLIPSGFRPLIEAEKEAEEICIFEPLLIPGLFQDVDYARMVLSSGLRPDKAEELVAIRMERQKLFDQADRLCVFLLIREAVIRDLPDAVRAAQCKKLLDLAAEPKVFIQIIPRNAGVFQPCGFQVLSSGKVGDVAYVEGVKGHGQMLNDPDDVRGLTYSSM
ncbi:MAG: helix-turn-helix transcriptional regulator [Streptosporangiaceae bacterium]